MESVLTEGNGGMKMTWPEASARATAWLQLFRAPNLLTVPGDPMAGCFLAAEASPVSAIRLGLVAAAAVLLYMSGLLLNDYADLEIDRQERPSRPLPSGRVDPKTALKTSVLLGLAGVGLAFGASKASGWMAVILAGLIPAYNFLLKKSAAIGPLAMGSCRGTSFLMGVVLSAGLAGPEWAWIGAGLITLYIVAVSLVARDEMRLDCSKRWIWAPALVILVGLIYFAAREKARPDWAIVIGFLPVTVVVCRGSWLARTSTSNAKIPGIIGQWIGAIILLQAALVFCVAKENRWAGIMSGLLVILWGMSRLLARRFYAS